MSDAPASLVAEGDAALAGGDWQSAHDAYRASLDVEETPEALFGLGNALWWLGDLDGSLAYRERAYAAFLARSDPGPAFEAALLVILDYLLHVGNEAAARGWLHRARRLVQRYELEEMEGWLLLAEARQGPASDGVEVRLRHALALAQTWEDADLELCAMSQLGSVLVDEGRIDEGIALLDEAVAAALAGEGTPDAVVFTSCNMMVSCRNCADFERTVQWISAADRFVERYGCPFLHAECRVVYGNVLVDTGDWRRAEDELEAAVIAAARSVPLYHSQALAGLARLRLIQGRREEVRRLVAGIEDHPDALSVVARLHLEEGRPDLAEELIRRRLDRRSGPDLESGVLVELLGEAEIAQRRAEVAEQRGTELAERGRDGGSIIHLARGQRLRGRARMALDQAGAARAHLEDATTAFVRLGMPFEAARTRLLLSRAMQDQPELAIAEAQTSLRELEKVGANREADAAASLLRELGAGPARRGGGEEGALTGRERQVLALVGEGLSNPEIAERLYISRKTVEHHVARVLTKLGLRNRAEAAAEAVRLAVGDAPPNR